MGPEMLGRRVTLRRGHHHHIIVLHRSVLIPNIIVVFMRREIALIVTAGQASFLAVAFVVVVTVQIHDILMRMVHVGIGVVEMVEFCYRACSETREYLVAFRGD